MARASPQGWVYGVSCAEYREGAPARVKRSVSGFWLVFPTSIMRALAVQSRCGQPAARPSDAAAGLDRLQFAAKLLQLFLMRHEA